MKRSENKGIQDEGIRGKSTKSDPGTGNSEKKNAKPRSGFRVMMGLIGMVKPMLGIMLLAILMGCAGNLCASFLTIMGGFGLLSAMDLASPFPLRTAAVILIVLALARAFLRYAEQACNHYIAFKLLAQIRHKVFAALRRLAPAKLEGKERGNLISMITSDIELLEVFYAHTISPIAIAIITSIVMIIFVGNFSISFGVLALICYLLAGAVIPLINGHLGSGRGRQYRDKFGELNSVVLDNLRGMDEILQYDQGETRREQMKEKTTILSGANKCLKALETRQGAMTDFVIIAAAGVSLVMGGLQVSAGTLSFADAMIAVMAMMSSFGPVAALSSLSNNLSQTLACGNRVLDLLKEEPQVYEVENGEAFPFDSIAVDHVDFSYGKKKILSQFRARFPKGEITGILGKSGCGKSTLLKLLMRFFEVEQGQICYGETDVNQITTSDLRKHIAYVTQETFLFHDTIGNNIRLGNVGAADSEVEEAARKASLHDFVMSLPDGYDTELAELGDSLSGGERQRIGIARAFLHDPDMIFFDEPTSNLDSLNEGIILKTLREECDGKTVVLVSHRKSTMGIAREVIQM